MALPNRGHRPRQESPRGSELTDNTRNHLRAMRLLQGLTLDAVGAAHDPPINGKAVSEMEHGWGEMSIGRMERWAAAVGLRAAVTFTWISVDEES